MFPTPEQMAFAFAMILTRKDAAAPREADRERIGDAALPTMHTFARVATITLLLMTTLLLGLSYLHTDSEAEERAFAQPSPHYQAAVYAAEVSDESETASAHE